MTRNHDFEEEIKLVEQAKIYEVKNINNSKILTVEFTTGSKLTFYLTQNNNTWLIDKIE